MISFHIVSLFTKSLSQKYLKPSQLSEIETTPSKITQVSQPKTSTASQNSAYTQPIFSFKIGSLSRGMELPWVHLSPQSLPTCIRDQSSGASPSSSKYVSQVP